MRASFGFRVDVGTDGERDGARYVIQGGSERGLGEELNVAAVVGGADGDLHHDCIFYPSDFTKIGGKLLPPLIKEVRCPRPTHTYPASFFDLR